VLQERNDDNLVCGDHDVFERRFSAHFCFYAIEQATSLSMTLMKFS
jgi:hypothetical protein